MNIVEKSDIINKAFTLAEVLIALLVIGVVAALTIPAIIQEFKVQSTVSSLNKAYSMLSEAYSKALSENGSPDTWGLVDMGDATGLANLNTIMSKYFKITKNCGTSSGCFPSIYDEPRGGQTRDINNSTGYTKVILANGILLAMRQFNGDCGSDYTTTNPSSSLNNVCGIFSIDINGFKDPNKYADDLFEFLFTQTEILPSGLPDQTSYSFTSYCAGSSNTSWANGGSCTAWVLYKQNMDYLNCTTISWSGSSTCN